MLVHCRSIRQSVRLCTDCLSVNQVKEFVAYFNQYTIMQSIGMKTNQNMEDTVCQVILSKEISRPNSLCFTKNDALAASTLLDEIILIKLLCDFINITGKVNQWTELPFESIQSSINCGNIYLISGNAAPDGILRFSLTDGGMIYGEASELLKNEKCMSDESNA